MTNYNERLDEILQDFDVWCKCESRECQRSVNYEQAKQAITSLINEAVKSYEDNLLSTIDDISNKPWRAARHIRELYENTDSGSSDWYKQVADDWGLLEEFFSNGGMGKVRELMADPNFNVNYPERIAQMNRSEATNDE